MARKKNESSSEGQSEKPTISTESSDADVTVTSEADAKTTADTETAENTENTEKPKKPKKPRVVVPKREITIVLDCGRSRIKAVPIVDGVAHSAIILDSIVCQTDSQPFGEMGAYSMSREKIETDEGKKKDLVEHWVVGRSAKLQGTEWVEMSDADDNKVTYFPILALGAIASLPSLFDYSTGSNDRNRTLSIRLITLSLANPALLRKSIQECKWLQVDGVKYRLSFTKDCASFPEGYGASLFGRGDKLERPTLYTFDIGYGTACVTEYSNLGKLPKRAAFEPNGGGGVAQLIKEFAKATAQADSTKVIKPSQLREVLETAEYDGERVSAIAPDGRDVGQALESAIRNWIADSPLTFALESLGTSARRHPVVLAGGGFAIAPAAHLIKQQMLKQGIPAQNLIEPPNPGLISLMGLKEIYTKKEEANAEQAA